VTAGGSLRWVARLIRYGTALKIPEPHAAQKLEGRSSLASSVYPAYAPEVGSAAERQPVSLVTDDGPPGSLSLRRR